MLEPTVNAAPTSTEVLDGIVTTGTFTSSPVDPIETESPTATLLVLNKLKTVVPIPAVFPTEIPAPLSNPQETNNAKIGKRKC